MMGVYLWIAAGFLAYFAGAYLAGLGGRDDNLG